MRVPLLLSLSRLVLDGSVFAFRRAARLCVRRLAFGATAYLAGLGAVGFLINAAHTAMVERWGPVPSSLILAGALGVVALGFLLAAMPRRSRRRDALRRY